MLLGRLRRRARAADTTSLDEVRELLVECGTLEQGLEDHWPPEGEQPAFCREIVEMSDALAEILVALSRGTSGADS